jgi:hypothetical protein
LRQYLAFRAIFDLIHMFRSEFSIYKNAIVTDKSERIYFSNTSDVNTTSYGTKYKKSFFAFLLKDNSKKEIYIDIWDDSQGMLEIIKKQIDFHKAKVA